MDLWKGCRGLDPLISSQVKAAMPPFLIGLERQSLAESIAADVTAVSNYCNESSTISCRNTSTSSLWQGLATHLHDFVLQLNHQGRAVSDEDLRSQARLLIHRMTHGALYTAVDSPEWLDLFKRAHSLDTIPSTVSTDSAQIPDDLEVYHDLGLGLPTSSNQQRSIALLAMFQNVGPSTKMYPRFSSLPIPHDKIWSFDTLARPWPAAGVLGETLVTREFMAAHVLRTYVRLPITLDIHELDKTCQGPDP